MFGKNYFPKNSSNSVLFMYHSQYTALRLNLNHSDFIQVQKMKSDDFELIRIYFDCFSWHLLFSPSFSVFSSQLHWETLTSKRTRSCCCCYCGMSQSEKRRRMRHWKSCCFLNASKLNLLNTKNRELNVYSSIKTTINDKTRFIPM